MQRRFLLAAGLAATLASCSLEPPTGPVAGKAYFTQVGCSSCHRIGGDGALVGPDLTMVGFRQSSDWIELWLKNPQAWNPSTVMPNKRLSPAAIKAIASYLATLKGQDWPKGARPWDAATDTVARGRLIYLRAGCVACHGPGGIGGHPNNNVVGGKIPALANLMSTYTKPELVSKIKRGVAQSQRLDPKGPAPLIRMPAWGDVLDDSELDAVASYLLSLTPAESAKTDW
jgi:mono/diheme cytochrome c family protein